MLELYKDGQPIFYNMVNNAIKNNKLSHAYIFDSNGNPDVMDIVLSFVKEIICMDITDDNNIKNICKRIDDGNYVDVKVIKSDGMWIKKDQLLDLQSEFNNKALSLTPICLSSILVFKLEAKSLANFLKSILSSAKNGKLIDYYQNYN
jgi:hypothetical protein